MTSPPSRPYCQPPDIDRLLARAHEAAGAALHIRSYPLENLLPKGHTCGPLHTGGVWIEWGLYIRARSCHQHRVSARSLSEALLAVIARATGAGVEVSPEPRADGKMPDFVGLCPDPDHFADFYMPLSAPEVEAGRLACPEPCCARQLALYASVTAAPEEQHHA